MLDQHREYVLHTVEERGVRLVRLWFTDVLGNLKSFAISPAELENALEDGMTFDGSSIDGFSRIQEADVLAMPVEEAAALFEDVESIRRPLDALVDVGLGYLRLGQPSNKLSGGEAQRIKLAAELGAPKPGHALYVLDEPTTGLHFDDVKRLLGVLNRLVDAGHTVLVIEHHLDVMRSADWLIDLGPEGGDAGGELVATGTPEEVARVEASHTGRWLRAALKPAHG